MSAKEFFTATAIRKIGNGGYTFVTVAGLKQQGFLHCNVLNDSGFMMEQLKAGAAMVVDYEMEAKGPRIVFVHTVDGFAGVEEGVEREFPFKKKRETASVPANIAGLPEVARQIDCNGDFKLFQVKKGQHLVRYEVRAADGIEILKDLGHIPLPEARKAIGKVIEHKDAA